MHDGDDSSGGGVSAAAVTPSSPRLASAAVSAVPAAGGSSSTSRLVQPKTGPHARCGAPVVRNLRRASAIEAIDSFRRLGAEALAAELLNERVARSGVAPAASMLSTWKTFHAEAIKSSSFV